MRRIKNCYENKIVIEKSIFITRIFRVNNIDEVNSYLEEIRKKHFDATHNCYAYILGTDANIQKASDDGEPQKTAGFPMLEVLKRYELTDVLAIVTRYFGGTLLGTSGLIKAYSESVNLALNDAKFYIMNEMHKFNLTVSYSGYNVILKAMPYIKIENTSYTNEVIITAYCSQNKYDNLVSDLYKNKINPDTLVDLGLMYIEAEEN